jgi:DnaJ-class molecular chaperone
MRLKGKGHPGSGGAGDALVTVEIEPHAFFTRDGDDVRPSFHSRSTRPRGAKIKVPTVDGAVIRPSPPARDRQSAAAKGRGFSKKGAGARPAGGARTSRSRPRRAHRQARRLSDTAQV